MKINREMKLFWLGTVPGVGTAKVEKLLRAAGGIDKLYEMGQEGLEKLSILQSGEIRALVESREECQLQKRYAEMGEKGIRYISRYGQGYPKRLEALARPPLQLYAKGKLPDESAVTISIVGARECSFYGRDMARMFGFRLAKAGVQIVSGMARGVDGWAHQGALESGGATFAVLGSGVDVCYPAAHCRLYESILRRGGILSEYVPGTKARPQYFPVRNRIISGLSDGILLVEAREKSGSLITVEAALEQGRDVFVIPGRIGDELSIGCNRLIQQGAIPVLSPDDILTYYQIEASAAVPDGKCGDDDDKMYRRLQKGPVHMDVLCAELQASPTEVMKRLIRLQKAGKIREISRGNFEAI